MSRGAAGTPEPARPVPLAGVVDTLRCPVCGQALTLTTGPPSSLRCAAGHSFDVARQGYVSLLDPRSAGLRADTAAMVAARDRVHDAGFFDGLVADVADTAASIATPPPDTTPPAGPGPVVVDLGSGPGRYLRAALRGIPRARGLGIDLSKFGARAVARAEPAAGAVVADVWRDLPVRTAVADVALSVFAPRNPDETARILRPGGGLLVVVPETGHLAEIIEGMGMLARQPDKDDRLAAALADRFELVEQHRVDWQRDADAALIADLAAMGPSAFHHSPQEITDAARRLAAGTPVPVTGAVRVAVYRPR